MAVQLSKIFRCKKLDGTLAYATCLKRQKMILGMVEPAYPECNPPCPQGVKIKKMFPDYDMKAVKRIKHISLKHAGLKKARRKTQASSARKGKITTEAI